MTITELARHESARLHALIEQQTRAARNHGTYFQWWKVTHLEEIVGRIDKWLARRT